MPASYPASIKSFLTYQDQPGQPGHIVSDPEKPGQLPPATVDLTIDRARITNEIHEEIIAMEQNLGLRSDWGKYYGLSIGKNIDALFNGKANGHPDPTNNAIYPLPPPSHNHIHAELSNKNADDHPQYMRVDGARGFTQPVAGQWATALNHLVPLAQAQSANFVTYNQVEFLIWTTVSENCPYPIAGPQWTAQRYRMTGGVTSGYTNSNGMLRVDYSAANFGGILTFVFMKMPFPGGSIAYPGAYTYRYEEDQLLLYEVDNNGAWITFQEDLTVDRQALVALCWIVMGA
jgi:hypothetical protein